MVFYILLGAIIIPLLQRESLEQKKLKRLELRKELADNGLSLSEQNSAVVKHFEQGQIRTALLILPLCLLILMLRLSL